MDKENTPLTNNGDLTDQVHTDGLTVLTTAFVALCLMTGTGVMALPGAISMMGVIGFVLLVACEMICIYTGTLLARSMLLLQERHTDYQVHLRHPYPTLGMVTFGTPGRLAVSFCVNGTLFGTSVVFLLMLADTIKNIVSHFDDTRSISLCWWLAIIAIGLWPITWFGRPKDFWPIAIASAVVILLASWLITTQAIIDAEHTPTPCYKPITVNGFLAALGALLFYHSGHCAFPTLQVDMKERHKFKYAIMICYTIQLLFAYAPVSVAGYVVFGSSVGPNILDTISRGTLELLAEICFLLHFLTGFNTVCNPVCQEGEEILGIPKEFGYQRVLFRTFVMCVVLITAMTIPQFSYIVSLSGGLTCSALSFICPPLFYLKLCSMKGTWQSIDVPLHERVACVMVILIGLFLLVGVTYSSLLMILSSDFSKPCYL